MQVQTTHCSAQLGIGVESLADIMQKIADTTTVPEASVVCLHCARALIVYQNWQVSYVTAMIRSLRNHVTSFTPAVINNTEYVPINAIQSWCESFERRLAQNPNFWREMNFD
jgi:hypothetical protein